MSPNFILAHFLHHDVSCQLRTGKQKEGFLRRQLSHLTGLKVSRTDLIMAIGDGIRKAPPEQSDHTQGSSHQDRSLFFCRNRSIQGVHRGHSNWSTSVTTLLNVFNQVLITVNVLHRYCPHPFPSCFIFLHFPYVEIITVR